MIVFHRKLLSIGQVWFSDEPAKEIDSGVDLVEFLQSEKPLIGSIQSAFHTLTLHLPTKPDELLSKMKKDTRYEIKRAQTKDQLVFEKFDKIDSATFDAFIRFHGDFSIRKGREVLNPKTLKLYLDSGCLRLSSVQAVDGAILTWHSYLVMEGRSRLLHSASVSRPEMSSTERALIGRANRLHHWLDILWFRESGIQIYDLGGWYAGKEDAEKLKINQFKEEFGGELESSYNCLYPVSLTGKIYTWLKRLRG